MEGGRSDKPPDEDLPGRRFVEKVLRNTVRRVVESGVEKITEGPENFRNFVADLKLPKDLANSLLLQVDETKAGLYRVVSKEIRGFLQQTNLADELSKALRGLTIEIKTEIRFSGEGAETAETGRTKPEVKAQVRLRTDGEETRPAPAKDDEDS